MRHTVDAAGGGDHFGFALVVRVGAEVEEVVGGVVGGGGGGGGGTQAEFEELAEVAVGGVGGGGGTKSSFWLVSSSFLSFSPSLSSPSLSSDSGGVGSFCPML